MMPIAKPSKLVAHVMLAAGLAVSVPLAACGGGGGGVEPQTPGAAASTAPGGSTVPGTPTAPVGTATTGPAASATVAPGGPTSPMAPMKASAMGEDLQKLGLDAKALPSLNRLPPEKLRQVMKTFNKALGTQCTGCHEANDFHAPTKNKKIASKMWDLYVRGLVAEDGGPVFCDSCHEGKMEFLDRHDKKALSAWMDENFVKKLKRVDKKENGCETCHGDPFEPHILATWVK
ncbi:cytochrome c3 family protein [Labilithrix luteola]|nr:cytochrome c3 family protein [Labilithrix luteola]